MSNTPPMDETLPPLRIHVGGGADPAQAPAQPKTPQQAQVDQAAQERMPPRSELEQTGKTLAGIQASIEQTINPMIGVRRGADSVINGTRASETIVVEENTYSQAALADFAGRSETLSGNFPIEAPRSAGGGHSSPEVIFNDKDNFHHTVFSQVQRTLRRVFSMHGVGDLDATALSATNVILSAASQSLWGAIDGGLALPEQYIKETQKYPMVHIIEKSINLSPEPLLQIEKSQSMNLPPHSVGISVHYDIGPTFELRGTPQQQEKERAAKWHAERPHVWRVKYEVIIPLDELATPSNRYGQPGCHIRYDLKVDVQKGIPRKRDSIIKPMQAVGKAIFGKKTTEPSA